MPGCTAHADPNDSSCPERLGDTWPTRPNSQAFLFLKGGVDLSPGSPLGLSLGSVFAPSLGGGGHDRSEYLNTVGATVRVGSVRPSCLGTSSGGQGTARHCRCPFCHICLPSNSSSSPCPSCLLAEVNREVFMGSSLKPNKVEQAVGWGRGQQWDQDHHSWQLSWPGSYHLGNLGLPSLGSPCPPRSLARCLPGQETPDPVLPLPLSSGNSDDSCASQPSAPSMKGEPRLRDPTPFCGMFPPVFFISSSKSI